MFLITYREQAGGVCRGRRSESELQSKSLSKSLAVSFTHTHTTATTTTSTTDRSQVGSRRDTDWVNSLTEQRQSRDRSWSERRHAEKHTTVRRELLTPNERSAKKNLCTNQNFTGLQTHTHICTEESERRERELKLRTHVHSSCD